MSTGRLSAASGLGMSGGSKFGQIGPKMGQILDFLRSVSVHFGSGSRNVLKLVLKSPKFVPFGTNLAKFGPT